MKIKIGDKVTHPAHGTDIGLIAHVWADESLEVQFSDGEYSLDANTAFVVESAVEPKTIARFRPVRPETFRLTSRDAAFEEFLRENGTIRIQLPIQSVPSFLAKYKIVTGEDVEVPSEYASVINENSKWGLSITVLFPSAGLPLVPDWLTVGSNDIDDPDANGIFENDFGWELLSKGFRLGKTPSPASCPTPRR